MATIEERPNVKVRSDTPDSESHWNRPQAVGTIEIEILTRVQDIETADPRGDGCSKQPSSRPRVRYPYKHKKNVNIIEKATPGWLNIPFLFFGLGYPILHTEVLSKISTQKNNKGTAGIGKRKAG